MSREMCPPDSEESEGSPDSADLEPLSSLSAAGSELEDNDHVQAGRGGVLHVAGEVLARRGARSLSAPSLLEIEWRRWPSATRTWWMKVDPASWPGAVTASALFYRGRRS